MICSLKSGAGWQVEVSDAVTYREAELALHGGIIWQAAGGMAGRRRAALPPAPRQPQEMAARAQKRITAKGRPARGAPQGNSRLGLEISGAAAALAAARPGGVPPMSRADAQPGPPHSRDALRLRLCRCGSSRSGWPSSLSKKAGLPRWSCPQVDTARRACCAATTSGAPRPSAASLLQGG